MPRNTSLSDFLLSVRKASNSENSSGRSSCTYTRVAKRPALVGDEISIGTSGCPPERLTRIERSLCSARASGETRVSFLGLLKDSQRPSRPEKALTLTPYKPVDRLIRLLRETGALVK